MMNKEIEISPKQIAKAIEHLIDVRDDLQQRIDRAIEYINNNWDGDSYTDTTLKYKVAELNITELLEILGGKE